MQQKISQQDVTDWLRSAPPEQVVNVAHQVLDRISDYPEQQRTSFSTGLKQPTRNKLFDKQPA